jgi:hypothetical protein
MVFCINLILVRCEVAVGIQARDQTLQDFFDMDRSIDHSSSLSLFGWIQTGDGET